MVAVVDVQDPSRDIRDRVATASGIEEFPDKIWFHKLAAAVIDADRCVRCGTCVAACPSQSIDVATDGLPTLVRMCTGCSSCWDFCPLAGLRTERLARLWTESQGNAAGEGQRDDASGSTQPSSHATRFPPVAAPAMDRRDDIGPVRAAYEVRARDRASGAQDGGVVTALLTALLDQDYIQAALLSHKEGPLRGKTVLAVTPEQVIRGAGSVYDQTYPLGVLTDRLPEQIHELALVGTPCQVAGLRALQRFPWGTRRAPAEKVKLAIALFCTRSFDTQRLAIELVRQGVDVSRVAKVDVRDGKFRTFDGAGTVILETGVRGLRRAALRGCDECADLTGVLADIAVGNVGSRPGYTTVLIRTERGVEAWERVVDALDVTPLPDLRPVVELAARNRARADRARRRDAGADKSLWVRYREHLEAYLGTDRAPVTPPPHRSHHYTVAC